MYRRTLPNGFAVITITWEPVAEREVWAGFATNFEGFEPLAANEISCSSALAQAAVWRAKLSCFTEGAWAFRPMKPGLSDAGGFSRGHLESVPAMDTLPAKIVERLFGVEKEAPVRRPRTPEQENAADRWTTPVLLERAAYLRNLAKYGNGFAIE